MGAAFTRTKPLGDGYWQITGIVDGQMRTVTAQVGDDPSDAEIEAALERGESVQVPEGTEPPAPPNVESAEGAHLAAVNAQNNRETGGDQANPDAGGDVLDGNVEAVTAHIETVDDPAELDRLEAAEASGKGRKSVADAIAARREALAGGGE